MDPSAVARRNRRPPPKSDLYATMVIHGDDEEERTRGEQSDEDEDEDEEEDIYATMLYKDDDSSLPPLLQRLPKDFGAAIDDDEDLYGTGSGDFGTMIVKTVRNRPLPLPLPSPSPSSSKASMRRPRSSPLSQGKAAEAMDTGDGFSTFVGRSTVRSERESGSGTVVRRTGGGGGGSTMSMAVASMQAAEELGFGKLRKGSGSSQGEDGRRRSKISSSSIPDTVTREDPSTKYELLNELGAFCALLNA